MLIWTRIRTIRPKFEATGESRNLYRVWQELDGHWSLSIAARNGEGMSRSWHGKATVEEAKGMAERYESERMQARSEWAARRVGA